MITKTLPINVDNNAAFLGRHRPILGYIGLSLLQAWHYCLWFVPKSFPFSPLLSSAVTTGWLTCLAASIAILFLLPRLRAFTQAPRASRPLLLLSPLITCLASIILTCWPSALTIPPLTIVLSLIIGASNAMLWLLWGQTLTFSTAPINVRGCVLSFGIVLVLSLVITTGLPWIFAPLFTAALPLLSGALLIFLARSSRGVTPPPLLPRATARQGRRSILIVCLIAAVAAATCYFLVAIISWEELPGHDASFTYGVGCGALLMLLIACVLSLKRQRSNVFALLPWLLVLTLAAAALYVANMGLDTPAFLLALAITSVFELLLILYFAILTRKGYISSEHAFGLSAGCTRLGILGGNLLALLYERAAPFDFAFETTTVLLFICLLGALLIPLVRQEYQIGALTETRATSDLDTICADVAQEYGLSEREADVLRLLARGYSSSNIAARLVISTNTVNTHIKHIYDKLGIHKRAELLTYLGI
jgi:DNA-binding CsgD family transcriptional regulator